MKDSLADGCQAKIKIFLDHVIGYAMVIGLPGRLPRRSLGEGG
jgi:hypothetical protein